ncbi:MAG: carboxypeptidase-like regulatory domain-containing protein [Pyrinomonadaceae bacterium]
MKLRRKKQRTYMLATKSRIRNKSMIHRLLEALVTVTFLVSVLSLQANKLHAQSATATIDGSVTDQQGAVLPDVEIMVVNEGTGRRRQATTNRNGYFAVSLLPPGRYTVTAQRPGFATLQLEDVVLNVNDQRKLRLQLQVGEISESVKISGASLIQAESAAVRSAVCRESAAEWQKLQRAD